MLLHLLVRQVPKGRRRTGITRMPDEGRRRCSTARRCGGPARSAERDGDDERFEPNIEPDPLGCLRHCSASRPEVYHRYGEGRDGTVIPNGLLHTAR